MLFLFDFTWRSAHNAVAHNCCVRACQTRLPTATTKHQLYIRLPICMYDDELRAVMTAISPVLVRSQVCSNVYGDFVTTTTHQKTTKQQQRQRQRLMGPVCCCLLLAVTELLTLC